jgi:hypothetical protein
MTWTLYRIPSDRRAELDPALRDDVVSRQSQKVRDAASVGGPAGETYVLVEGSPDGIRRAEELLTPLGTKLTGTEGEALYRRFKEEEEQASSGMGLFFTEE